MSRGISFAAMVLVTLVALSQPALAQEWQPFKMLPKEERDALIRATRSLSPPDEKPPQITHFSYFLRNAIIAALEDGTIMFFEQSTPPCKKAMDDNSKMRCYGYYAESCYTDYVERCDKLEQNTREEPKRNDSAKLLELASEFINLWRDKDNPNRLSADDIRNAVAIAEKYLQVRSSTGSTDEIRQIDFHTFGLRGKLLSPLVEGHKNVLDKEEILQFYDGYIKSYEARAEDFVSEEELPEVIAKIRNILAGDEHIIKKAPRIISTESRRIIRRFDPQSAELFEE